MLTTSEILDAIQSDKTSTAKMHAREGQKYYEGHHDIENYRLYYYNADGQLVEDKTRSNIKISHPFFTEIADQEAQYMLSGGDDFVRSDIPELQTELDAYFNDNEDFQSELYDVITGTIVKGQEYMYAYKTEEDRIAFQCADSLGIVELRAKETSDHCDYLIYWYVDRLTKDNQKITRVQVWDDKQVYFYVSSEEGQLEIDTDEEVNPKPHTLYTKGDGEDLYYEDFGMIPFFRLDNCRKRFSGLKPIKALIDDYDLMSCGLSNNLQDASEYLVVVKGFQGDNIGELMQNIKTKKYIGTDESGDVDYKTVDVPYDARKTKLELDEKNIYRFGMAFNSAQLGDGNITNVVIKSRYALLDLKCTKLEIRLKQFMRKLLKIVLKEINDRNGTDYQQKDVYFDFTREVMTNAADNAAIDKTKADTEAVRINTLLNLASTLDNETIVQNVCDVLDIDYETIKDKIPTDDEDDAGNALRMLENANVEDNTDEQA